MLPELPFSDWLAADPLPDAARWARSATEHQEAVAGLGRLGAGAVVASRPTVEPSGSRRNQALVWTAEAGAVRVRDKRHLPDEPGYWEASWYDRGEPSTATTSPQEPFVTVTVDLDVSRAAKDTHPPLRGGVRSQPVEPLPSSGDGQSREPLPAVGRPDRNARTCSRARQHCGDAGILRGQVLAARPR